MAGSQQVVRIGDVFLRFIARHDAFVQEQDQIGDDPQ